MTAERTTQPIHDTITRYRFTAAFPVSILIGMLVYYAIGFLTHIIGRSSGEHGPELWLVLLYLIGGAALLMGPTAALMTLLAGRERWAWFPLWPILIYGGIFLAFSTDIQGLVKKLTVLSVLLLIPGLMGGAIPAFQYRQQAVAMNRSVLSPRLRILLATLISIALGILLYHVRKELYFILQPLYVSGGGIDSLAVLLGFFVPMISSAFAGCIGSLIAGPRAHSAFIFWPLLIFIGMCLGGHFTDDVWSEADYFLLANTILLYPAMAGSILPSLWHWRRAVQNEPPSLMPPRSVRHYIYISLLTGAGFYCWARFLLLMFDDDAISFLLLLLLSPLLVGWVCFLISQHAGPTHAPFLLVWPAFVIVGMGIASVPDIFHAGEQIGFSSASDIMLPLMLLFIPSVVGSALPALCFCTWSNPSQKVPQG